MFGLTVISDATYDRIMDHIEKMQDMIREVGEQRNEATAGWDAAETAHSELQKEFDAFREEETAALIGWEETEAALHRTVRSLRGQVTKLRNERVMLRDMHKNTYTRLAAAEGEIRRLQEINEQAEAWRLEEGKQDAED